MWIKKLKKKKIQFLVIGIILGFAAMILTGCLSFSNEVDKYIDKQYDQKDNACLMLYVTKGTTDYLAEKLENRTDIKSYRSYRCFPIEKTPVTHKETLVKDYINPFYAILIDDYSTLPFKLTKVKGDITSNAPKKGEVWVQNIVAEQHDINVSDLFTSNGSSLTVTTLVNDTRKPVSMTTGACMFISKEDAPLFSNEKELELLSIYSDTNPNELMSWVKDQYTNTYYSLSYDNLSDMKTKATLMTNLISKLGSVCAVFMFLVTLVIIIFFIRNTILNELNSIGIYKSVGFSTFKIMGFYEIPYAIVGLFSLTVGAFFGLPLSSFIGQIIMKYVGEYKLTNHSYFLVAAVICITFSILLFTVFWGLLRIRKISPVDAILAGKKSTKSKLKKSLIKNAHSSCSMAINDIFKYKGRSVLIVTVVTLTLYIAILLLNMCLSFDRMEKNAPGWVCMPGSDCFVSLDQKAVSRKLLDYIDSSTYVESKVSGCLMGTFKVVSKDTAIDLTNATIMSLDTYDNEKTDITYTNGRPPKNPEEIAIDKLTLTNTSYRLGDHITLIIEGTERTFMITGIFDSMMAPSICFTNDALTFLSEEQYHTLVGVNLKNPMDLDTFTTDIKQAFSDANVTTMKDMVDNIKVSVMQIMIPVTIIIIVIFFSFTLLNIINIILMNNAEQRRNFGIMKSFGFTTGYIIRRNVIRISLLSAIGIAFAFVLNELFNTRLFSAVLGVNAYKTEPLETILLLCSSIITITVLAILFSLPIRKTSPKELMEE